MTMIYTIEISDIHTDTILTTEDFIVQDGEDAYDVSISVWASNNGHSIDDLDWQIVDQAPHTA